MSEVSYYYSVDHLAKVHVTSTFSEKMKKNISSGLITHSFQFEENSNLFGYNIHLNVPLTEIYDFEIYIVDFIFSSVENLHNEKQEKNMFRLLKHLKTTISQKKAYYNFRIPTHIVDLLRVFNSVFDSFFICGGTVSYLGKKVDFQTTNQKYEVEILHPDLVYLEKHRKSIENISEEAFGIYQGQYHISPILGDKAKLIYTNWIDKLFLDDSSGKENIIIAQIKNKPVGFWTYNNLEYTQQTGLTAVSGKHRNKGIYTRLLNEALVTSNSDEKVLTIGTQFDNFIVQRVWGTKGLSPFLSIYNIHLDARG